MHARGEILELLRRHLVDVGHGLDAHAGHHQRLEAMLEQKGTQPLVHHVVVGRRHGDTLRPHRLQAVDDTIAHGGGRQSGGLRHFRAQLAVVGLALVESERGAGELDGLRAGAGQQLRRRGNALLCRIEALGRHAFDAEAGDDEAQRLAVHGNALFGHFALGGWQDQPEHGNLAGRAGAANAEAGCRCSGGAGENVATVHLRRPSCCPTAPKRSG